jgi:hypothetical protein
MLIFSMITMNKFENTYYITIVCIFYNKEYTYNSVSDLISGLK